MEFNLDKYYLNQHQLQANAKATNKVEYMTLLDIDSEPFEIRHTGIICTIGMLIIHQYLISFSFIIN